MSFIIKKASKQAKKLRILLSASSGSGKTYSGLLLANGLVNNWSKVCVIDTERESASMYEDFGDYNTIALDPPYSPERFIEAIKYAESEGMQVIILDSISHEWFGQGGCLDIHDKLGGTFRDWAKVTPRHNAFVNAMMTSTSHIIATVRRKEEYAISQTTNGKMVVEKLGLSDVQRDGINYEFDIVFEITNSNHLARATKDRTQLFTNRAEFLIDSSTGAELLNWAASGKQVIDEVLDLIRDCPTIEDLKTIHINYPSVHKNADYIASKDAKKEYFLKLNK